MDYELLFNSADTRALAKVLFLFCIPNKYTEVFSAMNEFNIDVVKVRNESY